LQTKERFSGSKFAADSITFPGTFLKTKKAMLKNLNMQQVGNIIRDEDES
jgi:hypothetical protein